MNDLKLPKSFAWLNATQFLGALNDNVFKLFVIFFVVNLLGLDQKPQIVAITSVMFVLPFILFSHAGGVLADRFSKRHIIVVAKSLEILVMLTGVLGLIFRAPVFLYAMVFVTCAQSAIFGPSKYSIVPELVGPEKLSRANGFLGGFSYLAIILGTFLPTLFLDVLFPGNYWALVVFCIVVAVGGCLTSLPIPVTPAVGSRRPFSLLFVLDIAKTMRSLWSDRYLFLSIIALAYFLFVGSFFQQNLLHYGPDYLGMDFKDNGYLFPLIALGIGVGSFAAGRLSGRNIEIGIVPVGAIGLTVCAIVLHVIPPSVPLAMAMLFVGGVSAGLFVVPLDAFVQFQAPESRRGEILACVNFLGFCGAAAASGLLLLLMQVLHLRSEQCFLVLGIVTGALALATIWVLPDFLVRFIGVVITKCIYRIQAVGLENIPVRGPALLVPNHVTWADALFLTATLQRRIRFVMDRGIYANRWFGFIFRLMRVIPISDQDGPRELVRSILLAREALKDGYIVCVFAEGAVTRNGNMQAFKPGLEKMAGETGTPIIPVFIGNAWGSILSHYYGRLLSGWPQRIPYPVTVIYGVAMDSHSTTDQVRRAVQELSTRVFDLEPGVRKCNLARLFVRTARTRWLAPAVSDTSGKALSFGRTLVGAIALGNALRTKIGDQPNVGILLPSSVGGVLANVAMALLGKVAVNINFTASAQAVSSALKQCEIRTVISSRAFLEKLEGLEAPPGTIMMEDLLPTIGAGARLVAFLKGALAPIAAFPGCRAGSEALATVIFSSGSTAEPKGIMLSHRNIMSNIQSFRRVIQLSYADRMCGILPFFHSFGYTVTLWCPLVAGLQAHYHPNPLDGGTMAEMVRTRRLTILLSTPTFLLAYIRRAVKEDFASLRAVITGAEKLKPRVADAFEERFGLRPMEGYGATELSPVAAVSIPDVEIDGLKQAGLKSGSVGHPIPGVAMKVVDAGTGEVLPPDREGILMVKGPNVMMGYLNNPAKTAEVLSDGWYNTGDLAKIDRDGFVFLLDRMSRYSKIGGEMVPHIAIEEKYQQALKTMNQAVFVTAAPDEKKGEQIVVFYTDEAGSADALHQIISESDLPNLWKPKKDNYVRLESVPTLGSGKLDLKRMKDLAKVFVETRPGKLRQVLDKILDKF